MTSPVVVCLVGSAFFWCWLAGFYIGKRAGIERAMSLLLPWSKEAPITTNKQLGDYMDELAALANEEAQ